MQAYSISGTVVMEKRLFGVISCSLLWCDVDLYSFWSTVQAVRISVS